jgi:hypothetical protein
MFNLSSMAGATLTNVEVRSDGASTAFISVPSLTVPASGNWTIVAHSTPFAPETLTLFEKDVSAVPSDQSRLIMRNIAALPGGVSVVLANEDRLITNLLNPNEETHILPAGQIRGAKLETWTGWPLADIPTLILASSTTLIVYIVGYTISRSSAVVFYTQQPALVLPPTGAGHVLAQVGVGSLVALLGAGLLLIARRRPAAA